MPKELKNCKILLVDDEVVFTEMLKLNLELTSQYTVVIENDACQAVDTATRELPDVIVLDLIMPGMDGFEVAEKLQENEATSRIPVVYLTAVSNMVKANSESQRRIVSKPVKLQELIDMIEAEPGD